MKKNKEAKKKPKNIAICSDGTGNSADKDRGTNVFKLYEAVDLIDPPKSSKEPEQIAIYDDGVGTESFKPLRILGGAFGWGLSRNVRELYAGLVRAYEPGDKIFLFGFSRGAFTARALGGFITSCGILRKDQFKTDADLVQAVEDTYAVNRARYMTGMRQHLTMLIGLLPWVRSKSRFAVKVERLHGKYRFHNERKIKFIGVWDTVDAVGLPFAHLATFINYFIYPFKFAATDLSKDVEQGRHALAIDDERHTFHPTMWTEVDPKDRKRIKQVWFAGVHSNVGGGYPKQGMSLASLEWMMTEAEKAGLRFVGTDREYIRNHDNVNDKLYNSRAGLAVYYRYKPRDIHRLCKQANTPPLIHETAIDRIVQRTEGYAPGNLPNGLEVVGNNGNGTWYPRAAGAIRRALNGNSSLLKRVKFPLWIRRFSHYIFLILTLLALWVAATPAFAPEQGVLAKLGVVFSLDLPALLLDALIKNRLFDFIVGGIVIFFLIGLWAEGKMRREFSEFWHEVAPQF